MARISPVDEVLKHIKLPFELHQYQKDDINRFSPENSCGYYLSMGLGKSVMAAVTGVYKLLNGFNTVITLVPASLIPQWYKFLKSLGVSVCKYAGSPTVRKGLDLDVDFLLMSYQIYQNDYEKLKEIDNPYFIIDEATVMCNTNNVLYRMLRGGIRTIVKKIPLSNGTFMTLKTKTSYPRIAQSVCLLTGTPIVHPTDAYGLIKITSPEIYTTYNGFKRVHVAVEDDFGNPLTYKNLDDLHNNLVANAVIREVDDHLDLPEKFYNVVEYDLAPAHMKVYKKILEERMLVVDGEIVIDALEASAIYHLAQELVLCPEIVGFDKDPEGINLLDTLVEGVKQVIIFNHHVSANSKVMARYNAGGCFGEVSRADQTKYIQDFQEGKLKVLVANTKSAGVGLNLQGCNQVVFSELPVTSRDMRQAESRCWRQGQKNRVVITVMVAKGTIQQTLLKRIMSKDDVSGKVLHTKKSLREDLIGIGA